MVIKLSGTIKMTHGSGGRLMHRLVDEHFIRYFGSGIGGAGEDAAEILLSSRRCSVTVDAFVVQPLFFSGGDIGKLSICGTVNDLAAKGAVPKYICASFVIEEGFEIDRLDVIVHSMAKAADEAGVRIVAGDTKVVERGGADGIFITTCGIGENIADTNISGKNAQPGDVVIITGAIAEHGISVLFARNRIPVKHCFLSDCAPLGGMICDALREVPNVHVMRDPTRGGLATTLVEISQQSSVRIVIEEGLIPIHSAVSRACGILGIDPLYVANEGKMVVICPEPVSERLLRAFRSHEYGKESAKIGRVMEKGKKGVFLKTAIGGMRPVIMLEGDPLPRIC